MSDTLILCFGCECEQSDSDAKSESIALLNHCLGENVLSDFQAYNFAQNVISFESLLVLK